MLKQNVDNLKLKAICNESPTAEVTITSLAMRERLRHTSNISHLKTLLVRSGEKIVDEDYMKFWKGLQEAGVGVIVYGRKGGADRFEWHYNLKTVAKIAMEDTTVVLDEVKPAIVHHSPVLKVLDKPKAKRGRPKKEVVVAPASTSNKVLFIPLRSDCDMVINLPADLTKEEIAKISRALNKAVG